VIFFALSPAGFALAVDAPPEPLWLLAFAAAWLLAPAVLGFASSSGSLLLQPARTTSEAATAAVMIRIFGVRILITFLMWVENIG